MTAGCWLVERPCTMPGPSVCTCMYPVKSASTMAGLGDKKRTTVPGSAFVSRTFFLSNKKISLKKIAERKEKKGERFNVMDK